MAPSVGNVTAETVVSSGTHRTQAPDGKTETKLGKVKLVEKLQQSAVTVRNRANSLDIGAAPVDGDAMFRKFLEAVYIASKNLDKEIAATSNTKKEIKGLVAGLSQSVMGLIKWGKISGKTKPPNNSRETQTESTETAPTEIKRKNDEAGSNTVTPEDINKRLAKQDQKLEDIMTCLVELQNNHPAPKPQGKEHGDRTMPRPPKGINLPPPGETPSGETAWTEVGKRGKKVKPAKAPRVEEKVKKRTPIP